MSCCRQSRANDTNLVALQSPARLIDHQPAATPALSLQFHHPASTSSHVAHHHGASLSPPLPSGTIGSHGRDTLDGEKLVIAIDFGTTFSGVAYGSSRIAAGRVQQIIQWPGSSETYRKIPTCLLYDEQGRVLAWGLEAKNASIPGTSRFEWFKLFLDPRALRDEPALDPRLPALPAGKTARDLIEDFLSCLWEYAREQITAEIGAIADLNTCDVWMTVPAAWDAKGCALMRRASIDAGLVQKSHSGDTEWRDRLKIITEPEAAAVHCAHLTDLHQLRPGQNFIVCDAGGGTVDLAVYKILGDPTNLEIAEIALRSGASCGSLFLDLRFRALVEALLVNHPAHLDPASLAYFMNSFSEADKLDFRGNNDETIFYFNCFNVGDADDPSVGLLNGQLGIPGRLLREAVFDPVVDEVLELVTKQLAVSPAVDALLLVGGFSGSAYLMSRVEETFGTRIHTIARPPDSDTATLRGAARYGLARRPLVSHMVVPRSLVMKVKLPAEPEDRVRRPAYIFYSEQMGADACENRLQYLAKKGAIVKKGERIMTRFCKFSKTSNDTSFTATLYVANDAEARYADEARGLRELCIWEADLRVLPAFKQAAVTQPQGGFYTDFQIGVELDGGEISGQLMSIEGGEYGRVVFGFF
ncbi:actin-like ATPase domain-containing protein [Roridomyces roridus]|uniref:Actin-like ATPase domain-containing protein n=1 Tax=Roridomyces roridus TaxID=1738132 RepID=A0AAD7FHS5_9AGAR|nr:actin-like ATPase domain-containing protein [Roridomyces roridus]